MKRMNADARIEFDASAMGVARRLGGDVSRLGAGSVRVGQLSEKFRVVPSLSQREGYRQFVVRARAVEPDFIARTNVGGARGDNLLQVFGTGRFEALTVHHNQLSSTIGTEDDGNSAPRTAPRR
jgi:hypothetical protein